MAISGKHIAIAATAAAVAGLGVAAAWPPLGLAQPSEGEVRVTGILALASPNTQDGDVPLPDRQVTLRLGGQDLGSDTTRLDGRFHLVAPRPGAYQICWTVGASKGCGERFNALPPAISARIVRVRLERPFVHGKVLNEDSRPCWLADDFFGIDASTVVEGGGARTRPNTQGHYVLVGPAPGTFAVTARCEGAVVARRVTLGTGPTVQDIPLGGRSPRFAGLAARVSGRGVVRADPGATLDLAATLGPSSASSAPILWRLPGPENGTLSGGNGPTQTWTLPAARGLRTAYALARDGQGNFGYKRFEIRVGPAEVTLSGRVVEEESGTPIPGAAVTLGSGGAARSDANGWFSFTTAERSDDRYVVNITHPGHALLSRIAAGSAVGATYEMIRAQVSRSPADQPIAVTDRESAGPCGPAGADNRPPPRLSSPKVLRDDPPTPEQARADAILVRRLLEPRPCDRRGAEIRLPANALLDQAGNPARGTVRTALTTFNPERRAIPGDYRATDTAGRPTELESFGAIHVDLLDDATGQPLRIRPGAVADVRIPVPPSKTTPPASIPMWSYDEATGFWKEEGTARLQTTSQGSFYAGQTSHFSSLNMDVAGNDPAHATCVRFELDPRLNAWSDLVVRAYVSYGGSSVQVKETPIDSARYHAIYRIPFATGTPNTLRLELRGKADGHEVILLSNVIDTDARPKMTGMNLWPPLPLRRVRRGGHADPTRGRGAQLGRSRRRRSAGVPHRAERRL
ncbi:carboxypeptidase regulatory-like domain-containing protein [Paracraurococcus lichenis]|uniref:Carboxypeptidase regulatory-like domain-containing protein n=1 Tax=Paracraurococcus lichenis TaxID=3064888 RepID=A0ABT9E8L7_9PROT|nr:carboxypeptidase regulatory-like domain-containing protein [Paracraurococcus sp. LOR1-02]MDO9712525.1 carboxypeptidase regulatory-like domain-containing protein [Paracraurococcus sp. LOR1-02]